MTISQAWTPILILQGGGALGAYECGVYRALVEAGHMDHLAVVAGTSIGAINAGLIARHSDERLHGAEFLEHVWKTELTHESFPFFSPPPFPSPGDPWRRWNAVWTSFLIGHPHLFTPRSTWPIPWIFRPPPSWSFESHFYDAEPLQRLLHRPEIFGAHGPGGAPRLIVTAVDIRKGKSAAFDSGIKAVTADHIVASGSLPPSYPPKSIEGEEGAYWDGGIWSNTPLREVLDVLRSTDSLSKSYHVYMVDTFPQEGSVPQNNGEVFHRMSELTYADKTAADVRTTEWVNEYIELVMMLEDYRKRCDVPPGLESLLERAKKDLPHYAEILQDKRVQVRFTHLRRQAWPDEERELISGGIDFSPERIEELIEQGYRSAQAQLKEGGAAMSPAPTEAAKPEAPHHRMTYPK